MTKREAARARSAQRRKARVTRQRECGVPKRKSLTGERNFNRALDNAARHLRWLAPRLATRGFAVSAERALSAANELAWTRDMHAREFAA